VGRGKRTVGLKGDGDESEWWVWEEEGIWKWEGSGRGVCDPPTGLLNRFPYPSPTKLSWSSPFWPCVYVVAHYWMCRLGVREHFFDDYSSYRYVHQDGSRLEVVIGSNPQCPIQLSKLTVPTSDSHNPLRIHVCHNSANWKCVPECVT